MHFIFPLHERTILANFLEPGLQEGIFVFFCIVKKNVDLILKKKATPTMPVHTEYFSTHNTTRVTPNYTIDGMDIPTITMMRLPNGNLAPVEGWEDVKINVLAKHFGMSNDFCPIDVTIKCAEKELKEAHLYLKDQRENYARDGTIHILNVKIFEFTCRAMLGYILARKKNDISIFEKEFSAYKDIARRYIDLVMDLESRVVYEDEDDKVVRKNNSDHIMIQVVNSTQHDWSILSAMHEHWHDPVAMIMKFYKIEYDDLSKERSRLSAWNR